MTEEKTDDTNRPTPWILEEPSVGTVEWRIWKLTRRVDGLHKMITHLREFVISDLKSTMDCRDEIYDETLHELGERIRGLERKVFPEDYDDD